MTPRGQYDRTKGRASAGSAGTATGIALMTKNQLVPVTLFTKLSGWDKLNESEQKQVFKEGEQLAQSMLNLGVSRIAIGEHLTKLRDILEPHNLFSRFLRGFTLNKRTAYRYMAGFENAKARLPEPILKAAMARGMNIVGDTTEKPLGVYTTAVAILPPPSNPNPEQASQYLDQVEDVRRKNKGTIEGTFEVSVQAPEELLKEAYRFAASRFKKLPTNSKTRAAWVNHLCGMLLTDLGVSGGQTIKPIAVPEDFRAQRGRPREQSNAA